MPATTPETPRKPRRLDPIPRPAWPYHRLRKWIHFACFLLFLALPFLNVMRFDLPRQRFYFAGFELWINEFAILFFSLLFLLFVVVGMALLYGRIFCGYLCPQTIFSEAAQWYEARIKRFLTKRSIRFPGAERALSLAGLAVASVFLAFVFISYFVEPRDLLSRLLTLDLRTAGGVSGAVVTLITFLDFAFIRQRFCTTVCPYGYLQGMLVDKNSLLVHYRDENHTCIECKKCVRVCPMGIDIRDSPKQIECTHCGECIDACTDVLGRLGRPTLIHYAWGEKGELMANRNEPWYRRAGFRDPKRAGVLLVLLFYFSGLMTALSMRHTVLVQLRADRGQKIYELDEQGGIHNKYRLRVANRGTQDAQVTLSVAGLAGASLSVTTPISVAPNAATDQIFELIAPPDAARPEVLHVKLTATVAPGGIANAFETTFLSPPTKRSNP